MSLLIFGLPSPTLFLARAVNRGLLVTSRKINFRQAALNESDRVALVARTSRANFLPYLPKLHSIEDENRFYRDRVFPECSVWVAEENQELVGFCAFKDGWVEHLYMHPDYVGKAIGKTLLEKAKHNNAHLQLWVFQKNTRAISFYERNGFRLIRETDGASNEEKLPDALYEWRRTL